MATPGAGASGSGAAVPVGRASCGVALIGTSDAWWWSSSIQHRRRAAVRGLVPRSGAQIWHPRRTAADLLQLFPIADPGLAYLQASHRARRKVLIHSVLPYCLFPDFSRTTRASVRQMPEPPFDRNISLTDTSPSPLLM
ncbi:hypothetical protein EJB05_33551, partial [Eragrostis curvula]